MQLLQQQLSLESIVLLKAYFSIKSPHQKISPRLLYVFSSYSKTKFVVVVVFVIVVVVVFVVAWDALIDKFDICRNNSSLAFFSICEKESMTYFPTLLVFLFLAFQPTRKRQTKAVRRKNYGPASVLIPFFRVMSYKPDSSKNWCVVQ